MKTQDRQYTVALLGNPNCGKTTLYNVLTGERQWVGNWAGVTVEKTEGKLKGKSGRTMLVDLPGVYSLFPYSPEEGVPISFLLDTPPDVIINVVDGTSLERNLFLTLELLELRLPTIIAMNMADSFEKTGGAPDTALLSRLLGVPVIPVSAKTGQGIAALTALVDEMKCAAANERAAGTKISLSGAAVSRTEVPVRKATGPRAVARAEIEGLIGAFCERERLPFLSARLLAGDDISDYISLPPEELQRARRVAQDFFERSGEPDSAACAAALRYREIEELLALCNGAERREPRAAQRLDDLLTNKYLALPLFFAVVAFVFFCTFGYPGSALCGVATDLLERAEEALRWWLLSISAPGWAHSLLLEAVFGGLSAVFAFVPQLGLLFLFLCILEDSGYMARAAFMTDLFLRRIGLSGKSFIPLLLGFGCTTSAVVAARGIQGERGRHLTVLLVPFLPCAARVPIYALFSGVFFKGHETLCILLLYALSIAVAIGCAALYGAVFKVEHESFLMELPPLRLPGVAGVARHVWGRVWGFLQRAGSVIFLLSILIWLLQNITPSLTAATASESIFAGFGRWLAPVFRPLGFPGWRESVAVVSGLVAKESVVSTLGVLYGGGGAVLSAALAESFTRASALSFMVFSLLYAPCVSATVAICRELHSVWRGVCAVLFQTAVAYLTAFVVYSFALVLL